MTHTLKLRSLVSAFAGIVAATAIVTTASADMTEHNSHISCYASVHHQCYGNGANNCSDEDYDWGLDQCDSYYSESNTSERPAAPAGLKAKRGANKRFRATLKRTFK